MKSSGVLPSRRSTAPASPISVSTNSPPSPLIRAKVPKRSLSSCLPPVERRSLKKLRKYYIANMSSKGGSTQDQSILSAAYYQWEGINFIRLDTLGTQSGKGILLLESPRPNQGPSIPRLLRTISQSKAIKSIGNLVPIAPNFGYFTVYREASDSQINNLTPSAAQETITYQGPIPFDNLVVLAGKISARRSRRSLDSPARTWFIPALWEGLKRLQTFHGDILSAGLRTPVDRDSTATGISALVDTVMHTFGDSLLLFHHKVLKIQQKSDRSMSASRERKNIVRQEIAERNQDIIITQASWHAAEQEKEKLRRRESLLRKKLSLSSPAVH